MILRHLLRAFLTEFTNNIYYNIQLLKWYYCTKERQTEAFLIINKLAIQKRNNTTLHGFSCLTVSTLTDNNKPSKYLIHHFKYYNMFDCLATEQRYMRFVWYVITYMGCFLTSDATGGRKSDEEFSVLRILFVWRFLWLKY